MSSLQSLGAKLTGLIGKHDQLQNKRRASASVDQQNLSVPITSDPTSKSAAASFSFKDRPAAPLRNDSLLAAMPGAFPRQRPSALQQHHIPAGAEPEVGDPSQQHADAEGDTFKPLVLQTSGFGLDGSWLGGTPVTPVAAPAPPTTRPALWAPIMSAQAKTPSAASPPRDDVAAPEVSVGPILHPRKSSVDHSVSPEELERKINALLVHRPVLDSNVDGSEAPPLSAVGHEQPDGDFAPIRSKSPAGEVGLEAAAAKPVEAESEQVVSTSQSASPEPAAVPRQKSFDALTGLPPVAVVAPKALDADSEQVGSTSQAASPVPSAVPRQQSFDALTGLPPASVTSPQQPIAPPPPNRRQGSFDALTKLERTYAPTFEDGGRGGHSAKPSKPEAKFASLLHQVSPAHAAEGLPISQVRQDSAAGKQAFAAALGDRNTSVYATPSTELDVSFDALLADKQLSRGRVDTKDDHSDTAHTQHQSGPALMIGEKHTGGHFAPLPTSLETKFDGLLHTTVQADDAHLHSTMPDEKHAERKAEPAVSIGDKHTGGEFAPLPAKLEEKFEALLQTKSHTNVGQSDHAAVANTTENHSALAVTIGDKHTGGNFAPLPQKLTSGLNALIHPHRDTAAPAAPSSSEAQVASAPQIAIGDRADHQEFAPISAKLETRFESSRQPATLQSGAEQESHSLSVDQKASGAAVALGAAHENELFSEIPRTLGDRFEKLLNPMRPQDSAASTAGIKDVRQERAAAAAVVAEKEKESSRIPSPLQQRFHTVLSQRSSSDHGHLSDHGEERPLSTPLFDQSTLPVLPDPVPVGRTPFQEEEIFAYYSSDKYHETTEDSYSPNFQSKDAVDRWLQSATPARAPLKEKHSHDGVIRDEHEEHSYTGVRGTVVPFESLVGDSRRTSGSAEIATDPAAHRRALETKFEDILTRVSQAPQSISPYPAGSRRSMDMSASNDLDDFDFECTESDAVLAAEYEKLMKRNSQHGSAVGSVERSDSGDARGLVTPVTAAALPSPELGRERTSSGNSIKSRKSFSLGSLLPNRGESGRGASRAGTGEAEADAPFTVRSMAADEHPGRPSGQMGASSGTQHWDNKLEKKFDAIMSKLRRGSHQDRKSSPLSTQTTVDDRRKSTDMTHEMQTSSGPSSSTKEKGKKSSVSSGLEAKFGQLLAKTRGTKEDRRVSDIPVASSSQKSDDISPPPVPPKDVEHHVGLAGHSTSDADDGPLSASLERKFDELVAQSKITAPAGPENETPAAAQSDAVDTAAAAAVSAADADAATAATPSTHIGAPTASSDSMGGPSSKATSQGGLQDQFEILLKRGRKSFSRDRLDRPTASSSASSASGASDGAKNKDKKKKSTSSFAVPADRIPTHISSTGQAIYDEEYRARKSLEQGSNTPTWQNAEERPAMPTPTAPPRYSSASTSSRSSNPMLRARKSLTDLMARFKGSGGSSTGATTPPREDALDEPQNLPRSRGSSIRKTQSHASSLHAAGTTTPLESSRSASPQFAHPIRNRNSAGGDDLVVPAPSPLPAARRSDSQSGRRQHTPKYTQDQREAIGQRSSTDEDGADRREEPGIVVAAPEYGQSDGHTKVVRSTSPEGDDEVRISFDGDAPR
ncbi:hypothetical protein HKX48_006007 [Thoreauomyces humboldtii]|nr:hypothetical protein HKX48_006007 [Thoreauomyces humboldtii]